MPILARPPAATLGAATPVLDNRAGPLAAAYTAVGSSGRAFPRAGPAAGRDCRRVVLFSGGAASWAAARRLVDRGDAGDLVLLFTDTRTEDEDLYRFLDEAAADIGAELVRLADGRDIWQVFRDERFLGNTRADPCSRVLKRDLSRRWLEANRDPAATVVTLGLDWTELHRLERARRAWAPWHVDAPLTEPPYRLKAELLAELEARGIRPPRLYGMGFEHNNCGGGCVKAGRSHFARLLEVFPERFAEWERNEEGIRQHLGADVAILRDRSDDTTRPLTLADLRRQIEAGQSVPMFELGGCGCFEAPDPSTTIPPGGPGGALAPSDEGLPGPPTRGRAAPL